MRSASISELAAHKGLVGGPFGSSLVGSDYVDSGVPVIRGSSMSRGKYVADDFVYVSTEKFERDLARNSATAGDLIFTQRGTLGQVCLVPTDHETYVISQSQMRLRVDPDVADAGYVYYACSSPQFLSAVDSAAIRTGVPHINLGILSQLEIPAFPLSEQRAIAEVLGALDDKIAANDRARELSDDLRRLLFASGVSAQVAAAPLSSLARFVNGRNFTKDASGAGRPVIRIAELNTGFGGSTVYNDITAAEDNTARPGDLLFAWSGSLTLRRWYLAEGIINQHIFKVLPNSGWPMWLVAGLLERKLDEFKAIAADKATTMGHIQRRHLDEPVPVPDQEWVSANGARLEALWSAALAMEIESQKLAELRDVLLPELMSGRMRVKDAETTVEGVL